MEGWKDEGFAGNNLTFFSTISTNYYKIAAGAVDAIDSERDW